MGNFKWLSVAAVLSWKSEVNPEKEEAVTSGGSYVRISLVAPWCLRYFQLSLPFCN